METLPVLLAVDARLATKLTDIALPVPLVRNLAVISAQIVEVMNFRLVEQQLVNNVLVVLLVTTLTVTV